MPARIIRERSVFVMKFKKIKQRGQVMVLWALLTLICFVPIIGVGMDLGWYYLNVSRLQNAADAAVLAGAMKLVEQNQDLKDYYVYTLSSPPTSDFKTDGAYVLYYIDENTQRYSSKPINETPGKEDAKMYANKNLSATNDNENVKDKWNTAENEGVEFSSELYARKMDIDREGNGIKYYKVTLTEKVGHLFLRGWEPMEAKVVAYALLKPHSVDFVTIIDQLEKTKVIGNWQYQLAYQDSYKGKWNHYRQTINSKKAVAYATGDTFRTETINVRIAEGNSKNNTKTSSGQKTSANGDHYYSEMEVDALNIDFNQDVQFSKSFSTDWDLRSPDPSGVKTTPVGQAMYGWDANHGFDLRIQGLINFDNAWSNRNLLDSDTSNNTDAPDVLWTRIESDPIWSDARSGYQKGLNSVHQMIINVHADNTKTTEVQDANNVPRTVYEYRPFFIFYMGPEVNDTESLVENADKTFAEDTSVRKSQPVILNLYEDWNAILYMPNSPVIINGNGHKLNGFVVAKEFLRLAEDKDYTDKGYVAVTYSSASSRTYSSAQQTSYTIFIKQTDLDSAPKTLEAVKQQYPDTETFTYSFDEEDEGNYLSISKVTKASGTSGRLVISIDKEDAKNYNDLTSYINATYKAKFMAATGLSESEISTVTFPHNKKEEFYAVATADLSDTQKTGYVKVLVGTAEKYIDKKKLPYIKARRNGVRPYISVYDLEQERIGNVYGVNTIDDSKKVTDSGSNYDDSADLWRPTTDTYKSDRFINKTLMDNTYSKEYTEDKLAFELKNGYKYFMLKTEIATEFVAEYRKVTREFDGGSTQDYYIKEFTKNSKTGNYNEDGTTYYVKVLPGGSEGKDGDEKDVQNYIIVDNKGDLQTKPKPLSDSSYGVTRPTNKDEKPDDEIFKKRITNPVTGEIHDYRIPSLEVVYKKKEAFNLSEDSYYSYFQIPVLRREVYIYLNVDELNHTVNGQPSSKYQVDDMFFTTKRASWMD